MPNWATHFYFYITYFDFTERSRESNSRNSYFHLHVINWLVYDRFGQFAGAGQLYLSLDLVTVVACIEHRTEGFVLVLGNMFKLAGSVILFGVFSAFVIALIKTILVQWGGL